MSDWSVITGVTSGMKVTLPSVVVGGPCVVVLDSGSVLVVTGDGAAINGSPGAAGVTVSAPATVFYSNGSGWTILSGGSPVPSLITLVTTTTAITAVPGTFIVDTPVSAHTITLPPVGAGGPVTVKNMTTVPHTVTVKTADSSTIDGVAGSTGYALLVEYDTATFISDGVAWHVASSQLHTPI